MSLYLDFEDGQLPFEILHIDPSNDLVVAQENPYAGLYALRVDNGGLNGEAYGFLSFPQMGDFSVTLPLLVPSDVQMATNIQPLYIGGPSGMVFNVHVYPSGVWQVGFSGDIGWTGALPAMSRDIYHLIKVVFSAAVNGYAQVFLDGVMIWESNTFDTSALKANSILLGNRWGAPGTVGSYYIDDVLVEALVPPAEYALTIISGVGGTTNPPPGEHTYQEGTTVSVEAVPDQGYSFDTWDLNGAKYTENPISILIESDVTLTAGFASAAPPPSPPIGWNLPLHVEGKRIVDALGNDVSLLLATGVAKQGPEYDTTGTFRETDPAYYEADADMMATWGVRLVRVPTNRAAYYASQTYRDMIHKLVNVLAERGIVTIVEQHWWETGQLPQAYQVPYDQAWIYANGTIDYLTEIARDFLYQPMMIGVEVNEYRPQFSEADGGRNYEYLFKYEMWSKLEESVHAVNPNLLILMEVGYGGMGSSTNPPSYYYTPPEVMQQAQALIAGKPNMVLAPHVYFTAHFGRSWVASEYAKGPDAGKALMHAVIDEHYLSQQNYYNLPIIVTEWGGDHTYGAQVIRDEYDYFASHGWGGTYWAWFRQKPEHATDNIGVHLLTYDWSAPSISGQAFKDKIAEYQPPPTPPTVRIAELALGLAPILAVGGIIAAQELKKLRIIP